MDQQSVKKPGKVLLLVCVNRVSSYFFSAKLQNGIHSALLFRAG